MKYDFLRKKIDEKGIKLKKISETLGITTRALNNKLHGISPFTWEQACRIQEVFFPEYGKDELFVTEVESA